MSSQLISPEDIYRVYHREVNAAVGRSVRTVKNFDKIKSNPAWAHFERCAQFVNRNNGQVDYRIYLRALAIYFQGWFDPKHLTGSKSIAIYRSYINDRETQHSPEAIKRLLLTSIDFVVSYCKKHELSSLSQYLSEDLNLIPTIAKHYSAGSVSTYFLAAIEDFIYMLDNYPSDVVYDYFSSFKTDYTSHRMRLIHTPELHKISKNLALIIDQLIEKK